MDWNFLRAILITMNFDSKWIMECVTYVNYTLLVNGNLTISFKPSKGLRQGDPLSPYLFLLCANILSIALMQAKNSNKIKGIKVGRSAHSFTHLLFANDSLLFFRKDNQSPTNIQKVLEWYCALSGQKLNLSKSNLLTWLERTKKTLLDPYR